MPISRSGKPGIAITLGDPAGIGPEVTVKALRSLKKTNSAHFVVLGKADAFNRLSRRLRAGLLFKDVRDLSQWNVPLSFVPCYFPGEFPKKIKPGVYQRQAVQAAVRSIELGAFLALSGRVDALVTAPINKASVRKAGFKIPGHTEFLAELSGTKHYEMMLVGGPLRVVLVTRHLALSRVSKALTVRGIEQAILTTEKFLREKLGIKRPRLAVCALNPHAGESGHFGKEEMRLIEPAVARARKRSKAILEGPLSADVLFRQAFLGRYDAEICMYHDQGQIPLKMISRGAGVNVTPGLPFVRTSPDHGTGYDIAGRLIADAGSMVEALKLAVQLSRR